MPYNTDSTVHPQQHVEQAEPSTHAQPTHAQPTHAQPKHTSPNNHNGPPSTPSHVVSPMTNEQCAHSRCVAFDTPSSPPFFNQQNRFYNDACYANGRTTQSTMPGMYSLSNFYDCDTLPNDAFSIAMSQPIIQFKDGYGHIGQYGALSEVHSSLRNGEQGQQLTNLKGPQQLKVRPIKTVPFMGRGLGDPCRESYLKEGVSTFERRQCNTLAEMHLSNQYTPLIECLNSEVQNPIHILHEANQSDWVRGGYPSRQWVHQKQFSGKCPQRGGMRL